MQAAIEATIAVVMAVREVDNPVSTTRSMHKMPRSSRPAPRQPTLDWKAEDKQELYNIDIMVKNIFMTNNYNTKEMERVPIIQKLARPRDSGSFRL